MLHLDRKIFAKYSFHWLHELLVVKTVTCLTVHTMSKQVKEKKIKGAPNSDAEKFSVQAPFNLPKEFAHVADLLKIFRTKRRKLTRNK